MSKKKKEFLVPWIGSKDSDYSYVPFEGVKIGENTYMGKTVTWKSNKPFKACMKLYKIGANNYLPIITLQDAETKQVYRIEPHQFKQMLNTCAIILGSVIGWWSFEKSGRYFYLKFEGPSQ